jgi:hypothetical protein
VCVCMVGLLWNGLTDVVLVSLQPWLSLNIGISLQPSLTSNGTKRDGVGILISMTNFLVLTVSIPYGTSWFVAATSESGTPCKGYSSELRTRTNFRAFGSP